MGLAALSPRTSPPLSAFGLECRPFGSQLGMHPQDEFLGTPLNKKVLFTSLPSNRGLNGVIYAMKLGSTSTLPSAASSSSTERRMRSYNTLYYNIRAVCRKHRWVSWGATTKLLGTKSGLNFSLGHISIYCGPINQILAGHALTPPRIALPDGGCRAPIRVLTDPLIRSERLGRNLYTKW